MCHSSGTFLGVTRKVSSGPSQGKSSVSRKKLGVTEKSSELRKKLGVTETARSHGKSSVSRKNLGVGNTDLAHAPNFQMTTLLVRNTPYGRL